jgi:adenosylcobinamide-phosphate synthase
MDATALGIALLLDLALGDPPNRLHPVAWMGRGIAIGRRALCHGGRARLFVGGAFVTLLIAAAAALAGAAVEGLAAALGAARPLVEGTALWLLLSLRRLIEAARAVAVPLAAGDLEAARELVALHLVSRPTAMLGPDEVASAAVESLAENLTDALVAPVCFYLAFGLAGAAAYRAINTADAMIGYRDGALEWFGKLAARLDDWPRWASSSAPPPPGRMRGAPRACCGATAPAPRVPTPAAPWRRWPARSGSRSPSAALTGSAMVARPRPATWGARCASSPGPPR